MGATLKTIPMFLSVDVEPDAFQLRPGSDACSGFDHTHAAMERLRIALTRRTGHAPRFGWYVRTDPQMASHYGSADYLLRTRADRLAQLAAAGDYFGVHAHPLRWSHELGRWVHDISDQEWVAACVQFSIDRFNDWSGVAAERYRWGAGHMSDATVAVLDANNVAVDMTLEPVRSWAFQSATVASAVDDTPIVGSYVDCSGAPRVPYRPSCSDFRRPGINGDARAITFVPLSTWRPRRAGPWWKRVGRRIKGSPQLAPPQILYPSGPWTNATTFWDRAEEELRRMPVPYLSIAVRTDAADSALAAGVERVCMALADHPLADRVRLVDPKEQLCDWQ